jgi:hypothetical protein
MFWKAVPASMIELDASRTHTISTKEGISQVGDWVGALEVAITKGKRKRRNNQSGPILTRCFGALSHTRDREEGLGELLMKEVVLKSKYE